MKELRKSKEQERDIIQQDIDAMLAFAGDSYMPSPTDKQGC